jgi:multidrug efflux pump subunit AcrA (membrane-fusion protein)
MKKKFIILIIFLVVAIGFIIHKRSAKPGTANTPQSPGTFTISSDRQQLIGVKTSLVERKTLSQEIRTNGRMAFDPELAIAIAEYIEVSKNVPDLKQAAMSRLKLLGMGDEEIKMLGKKGAASIAPAGLYLPGQKDALWVYATLYENEMDLVKPGAAAKIKFSNDGDMAEGIVRGVDRVVDPQTRSVRARIEIPHADANNPPSIRPDSFVTVIIQTNLGENLIIPKSAVIDTGSRKLVYVKQGGGDFQMKEIKIGGTSSDAVIVTEGLNEGEVVVTDATFLIDSESQLKTSTTTKPTCPEGEEWDVGMAMCMPKI